MRYETFEKVMNIDRIESGTKEFKEYLKEYDFGSGKWNEINDKHYVLEKLFLLLKKSIDLDAYGEVGSIIEKLIVEVAQQKIIEPDWIKPWMDKIKLASYFEYNVTL